MGDERPGGFMGGALRYGHSGEQSKVGPKVQPSQTTGGKDRARSRSLARARVALGATVLIALLAVGALLALGGGGSTSFASQARAICTNGRSTLNRLPSSPTSIGEGLEIEHKALGVFTREVNELQRLRPPENIAARFHAGLADDQTLLSLFGSIIQRPDFVQLSLTLPGHPQLAPQWLKAWLARTQALQADAKAKFSEIGVPACEKLLR
jgi:hypothetical protein